MASINRTDKAIIALCIMGVLVAVVAIALKEAALGWLARATAKM